LEPDVRKALFRQRAARLALVEVVRNDRSYPAPLKIETSGTVKRARLRRIVDLVRSGRLASGKRKD
jgi:hypothetical protein